MTLVLNGKGLLLEGSNPKIENKLVPGIYIYTVYINKIYRSIHSTHRHEFTMSITRHVFQSLTCRQVS